MRRQGTMWNLWGEGKETEQDRGEQLSEMFNETIISAVRKSRRSYWLGHSLHLLDEEV